MVCRKVRTDASGSPWELTLIEFMHSSRRTILMAASTAPTMAARLGISSIPAIACERPWYYMHIIADPGRKRRPTSWMWRRISRPMAGTCLTGSEFPHGDNHGLWIDPRDTRRMIASNDGGVTVTLDGGKNWTREDNQPTAQFYHVITDTATRTRIRLAAGQRNGGHPQPPATMAPSIARIGMTWVGAEAGYIAPYPLTQYCLCRGLSGQHHALRQAYRTVKSITSSLSFPMLTEPATWNTVSSGPRPF